MFFCLECNKLKLDMDNHSDHLCKDCYIKNENDFWEFNARKALNSRRKNEGLLKNTN